MKAYLRREWIEDSRKLEELQQRLVETLDKREELKASVNNMQGERKMLQRRIEVAEANMREHHPGFVLLPPGEASKADLRYRRGLQVYNELQDTRLALEGWTKETAPKIQDMEFWIKEADAAIESLRREIGSFIVIEAGEMAEPVFDAHARRHKMPQ